MTNNDLSIDKRTLWKYVNKKTNRIIHHYHVFSVITILFDEIIKDLKSGKELNIFNFGILSLKEMKPRYYHNVKLRKVMLSRGYKILRFTLAPKLRKKLCLFLDIDKTLGND